MTPSIARTKLSLLGLTSLLLLFLQAGAFAAELLLADGTRTTATLAAKLPTAADEGELTFDAGGKRVTPALHELIRFGAFASPAKDKLAVLDSGDLVTFTEASLDGEQLLLKTNQLGDVTIPIATVRGLVLQSPAESLARDRLLDELAAWSPKQRDANIQVALDNGDNVMGALKSLTAAELTIESAAGAVTLPIDRVKAITSRIGEATSASRDAASRGVRFVVGTSDGSRFTATEIALTESGMQLKTAWGATLAIDSGNLVAIQTLGGRATYLSDLTASGYKHVPYLATTWPLALNRHVAGGRLRANGREFLKGLGMHSAATAVFTLDKPYRRFEAELAIDDSVFGEGAAKSPDQRAPRGSVIFRVYVDIGDGKWQLRHASETIRGGIKPTPVSVDVAKAKRVSLIVDFADRADEWDRADWLDARFVE
jgi:hypothetical protein